MTQHELLSFIDSLHGYVERSVSNKGPWCWPTYELLLDNLKLNRNLWGSRLADEFGDVFRTLQRKHWVAVGPCTVSASRSDVRCHARHISLTTAGLEALRLMNEGGCEGHIHVKRREQCHTTGFHLQRRSAA